VSLESKGQKFYHGGRKGMRRGQFILSPVITGAKSLREFGNHLTDKTKVYVTTEYNAALLYAAGVNGCVYEVSPIGDLNHDPDCLTEGLSFACDRAQIVKVHSVSRRTIEMCQEVLLYGQ
jgi:rifampin ADP-ribosylating transferase